MTQQTLQYGWGGGGGTPPPKKNNPAQINYYCLIKDENTDYYYYFLFIFKEFNRPFSHFFACLFFVCFVFVFCY